MLGGHEDALAMEKELSVRVPGRVEAPLQELGGLLVGGRGRTDVVEEVEGRPRMAWSSAASSELDSLSRWERAFAAALIWPGRYSTAKSKPNSLLSH